MAIVVVLYKAELSLFHKDLLKNGNITLIVVDNTPGRDLDLRADRLVYIPLGIIWVLRRHKMKGSGKLVNRDVTM